MECMLKFKTMGKLCFFHLLSNNFTIFTAPRIVWSHANLRTLCDICDGNLEEEMLNRLLSTTWCLRLVINLTCCVYKLNSHLSRVTLQCLENTLLSEYQWPCDMEIRVGVPTPKWKLCTWINTKIILVSSSTPTNSHESLSGATVVTPLLASWVWKHTSAMPRKPRSRVWSQCL